VIELEQAAFPRRSKGGDGLRFRKTGELKSLQRLLWSNSDKPSPNGRYRSEAEVRRAAIIGDAFGKSPVWMFYREEWLRAAGRTVTLNNPTSVSLPAQEYPSALISARIDSGAHRSSPGKMSGTIYKKSRTAPDFTSK